jgi:hypothetical protein
MLKIEIALEETTGSEGNVMRKGEIHIVRAKSTR